VVKTRKLEKTEVVKNRKLGKTGSGEKPEVEKPEVVKNRKWNNRKIRFMNKVHR
jgi:hypothetical protein